MVRLNKTQLLIGILCLVLGILCTDLIKGKIRQAGMLFAEEEGWFPELTAPERTVRELKEGERVCYLTFDDGPSENTERVLDILKEYDIKATFFMVGEEMTPERRKIVERVIQEGHCIGMHANRHVYQSLYASLESFLQDYDTLYQTLKNEYQVESALYRFPGGSVCSCLNGRGKQYIEEMKSRGFFCFDWNVSGEDAVGNPTAASIQEKVLSRGLDCRRAIVLLHDSAMAVKTVEALPAIIEGFREEGFRFDSLENAENYVFPASR